MIQKHQLIDDPSIGSISKETQIKLGAFLTNIMSKTLHYKVGKKEYMLLKPQTERQTKAN